MGKKQSKHCNGCAHSKWMAGLGESVRIMIGLPEPHPHATHTCTALNITRRRDKADMPKLPNCPGWKESDDKAEVQVPEV
jgi:hypothetical protein